MELFISIGILLFSIIAHEVAHGYAAYILGDTTAYRAGRLTLNPLRHIDFLGSIIIPLIGYFSPAKVIVGWAKPVPYNPYALKPWRFSEPLVAAAGVLVNFFLAIIFIILIILGSKIGFANEGFLRIAYEVVLVNVSLGVFNLLPLPPFDGMRIITSFFPLKGRKINEFVDRNNILFLIISIIIAMLIWGYIYKGLVRLISVFL